MSRKAVACFLLFTLLTAPVMAQTVVKKVLRFDQARPNLLKPESFRPYEKGFESRDGVYFCDNGDDAEARRGVVHSVTLNQVVPMPITAEAWSRAENVSGSPDANYSVYVDLVYIDGTPLWGQSASFSTGTHDWQRRQVTIMPEKPVRSLTFYTLFRNKSGKAWFRDFSLSVMELETGATLFDGVPIEIPRQKPKVGKTATLQIRDVAADSDFVVLADKAFDVWHSGGNGYGPDCDNTIVFLKSETDEDRCLTLVYSRKVEMSDVEFCEMRRNIPQSELRNREHVGMTAQYSLGNVAGGRLSKWPMAAVVGNNGKEGLAVAIDLNYPGFFRTGYNEATGELFVAVDFALTKESPKATFRFVNFPFEAEHGFRGAWAGYKKLFPDFFRCRTPEQGVWMPFHAISKVEGFEDFGFKFKEGTDETAWDDAHDITTFRYTEPMTWWMTLPKDTPRTYEAAVEQAKKLADGGNAWAKALFVCGMKDADGRLSHLFRDTPWCNGVVWSFCDLPDLDGGGYGLKWSETIAENLYGEEAAAVLDGEYVDSSEGYVTAVMNFDRNHFFATKTPLVFSRDEKKPAVFRGLVAYEYVRSMAEDVHSRGKLMMANSTPHSLCWLAPYLDVMGTETNWNYGGNWNPTGDAEMMFRRALCGPKPYCFLMNTDFTKWTYEMSEKFMKRSLAYGMFPGYFSADASTGHYFSQPELYNRDRPLFKKYVPVCKEVAQAGWQPVTKVQTSNEKVYVERFGDEPMFFTVFNDTAEEQTVTLRFESDLPAKWFDRLNGNRALETKDGSLTITLGPEDVIVLASKEDFRTKGK